MVRSPIDIHGNICLCVARVVQLVQLEQSFWNHFLVSGEEWAGAHNSYLHLSSAKEEKALGLWSAQQKHGVKITGFGEELETENSTESLNATYQILNQQCGVFSGDIALLKTFYLLTFELTKKWTMLIRD